MFVHFPVSLQADHALCATPSHQHALGPDCVGQHTEHSHQPLLCQYWKVLWSKHNPSGRTSAAAVHWHVSGSVTVVIQGSRSELRRLRVV